MSYENAPATIMLATHCACCARSLVDAASIEAGMGPVCRKRHGYNTADTEANWPAVAGVLLSDLAPLAQQAETDETARLVLADALHERCPELPVEALLTKSARLVANAIVHRIAVVAQTNGFATITRLIEAVRALGFTTLANVLTNRAAAVYITREGNTITVTTPYSVEFNYLMRSIPSRRWVKNTNVKGGKNVIAAEHGPQLLAALKKCFPGALASGPKGLFQLD
jgi:hypothetical protein